MPMVSPLSPCALPLGGAALPSVLLALNPCSRFMSHQHIARPPLHVLDDAQSSNLGSSDYPFGICLSSVSSSTCSSVLVGAAVSVTVVSSAPLDLGLRPIRLGLARRCRALVLWLLSRLHSAWPLYAVQSLSSWSPSRSSA